MWTRSPGQPAGGARRSGRPGVATFGESGNHPPQPDAKSVGRLFSVDNLVLSVIYLGFAGEESLARYLTGLDSLGLTGL